MTDNQILIGQIRGAHGVRGLLRVAVYADNTDLFANATPFPITLKNKHKHDVWLASADHIKDKDAADALKGTKIYCTRDDMPETDEGEIYHIDMVGMQCVDENGELIGIVEAVENFGAGDLLDIKPPKGTNFYLSYDDNTVLSVEDKIMVRMPEVI